MTIGELAAFTSYLNNVHEPLTGTEQTNFSLTMEAIMSNWLKFVKYTLQLEKTFEMMDIDEEVLKHGSCC